MRLLRPLPRAVTRPISLLVLVVWAATIGVLVKRTYLEASSVNLATDLARYGTSAQWRGIYYRGEKIGFSVNQVDARDDGFELQEDGRLQMTLFGAVAPVRIRTTARVDRAFVLQSFDFLLDPGTGPTNVHGVVEGRRLTLSITTKGGTTTDVRELNASLRCCRSASDAVWLAPVLSPARVISGRSSIPRRSATPPSPSTSARARSSR